MSKKGEMKIGNFYRILNRGKTSAISGAVLLVPVAVTLFAINWLLNVVAGIPGTGIFEITSYFYINQVLKLSVLLVTGGFFFVSIGNFKKTKEGDRLEAILDNFMNKVPVIRSLYNTTKFTTDTVLRGTDFGEPVKIKMGGMKLTGFRTGNKTDDGRNVIFVPTSPNVTSGFVVEIEDKWLDGTDETASEAITKVLSAGFGKKIRPEDIVTETDNSKDEEKEVIPRDSS